VPAGASCKSLRKPGKNRFLLVMVTLAWWGSACADNEWKRMVKEVVRELRNLWLAADENLPPTSGTEGKGGSQKCKQIKGDVDGDVNRDIVPA
jgi:hypothetical protein